MEAEPPNTWDHEDGQWTSLSRSVKGAFRLIRATRLLRADECMHEASGMLKRLFGVSDIDALGGARAATGLYVVLRQFASTNPEVRLILKAMHSDVKVMRSDGPREARVTPRFPVKLFRAATPDLRLYFAPGTLLMPEAFLGRRRDQFFQFARPHGRSHGLLIAGMEEQALSLTGQRMYVGRQRAVVLDPDNVPQFQAGVTPNIARHGPNLDIIRLTPYGSGGRYFSARLGINFSADGSRVTGMWSKESDFQQFLDMYPSEFTRLLRGRAGW